MADRAGRGGRAAISALIPPQSSLVLEGRLNLPRLQLPPAERRTLFEVGSPTGARYEAGVVRSRTGLRWAVWTSGSDGPARLAIGRRAVRGRWLRLQLSTAWDGPRARGILRVDGRLVVRSRPQILTGVNATRATVGLGPATSLRQRGLLFLDWVKVAGRAARSA
jgi:hypothetical protein